MFGCASTCDPMRQNADGCVNNCGICPSCVFAPSQSLWPVTEEFKRRLVLGLLLRCRTTQVLENIQRVLSVTSWTLFSYERSRRQTSAQRHFRSGIARQPRATAPALKEVWDWFSSTSDRIQSRYLCRLFSRCEWKLLQMVYNLTSVLLVRRKRGFLQWDENRTKSHNDQECEEDSDDPALMLIPGSSKSLSGVGRYRDFICCLPVDLSKRILGLLDEQTLRRCQRVCQYWRHLAGETMEEIRFRRIFLVQVKTMMNRYKALHHVSPTYASFVDVPVPVEDHERDDVPSGEQKVKPSAAAYANIQTKVVQMEERNVYCGAYFTVVLIDKEDPHRVVNYRGGSWMATGSKDCVVTLLHVAAQTKYLAAMKGHYGSVRAVLLCEEQGLVLTAGCDASIRCWSLQTEQCVMVMLGHSSTVNCLDVHGDRLVSGAKDCKVKVWNLQTGKPFDKLNFKHPRSVLCVKMNAAAVYSSCRQGRIRVWDLAKASLLREIDAHRSSVKCLFFDKWHLLSGDSSGQVMAWSISCDTKDCLMTFNHPKEVKSLTLTYLRVVTGCVDGKIRIFNFLTGDCVRVIKAEAETGRMLSLHFHDNTILVNTVSCVKMIHFAKVFWDYAETTETRQAVDVPEDGLVSDKSAATQQKHGCKSKKPERAQRFYPSTSSKCPAQVDKRSESVKKSVVQSEKETCERMKKRGLHHPLKREPILLRVSAIQRSRCMDEVSINMERNAKLRDSWGPPDSPQDPGHSVQHNLQPRSAKKTHHSRVRRVKT